jgi:hypothetical protein
MANKKKTISSPTLTEKILKNRDIATKKSNSIRANCHSSSPEETNHCITMQ